MSDAGSKRVQVAQRKSGEERATRASSCKTINGQSAKTGSWATREGSDASSVPCKTRQPPQKTSAYETKLGNCPVNCRGNVRIGSPKPNMIALLPSFTLPLV